jgi:hypothetical protein
MSIDPLARAHLLFALTYRAQNARSISFVAFVARSIPSHTERTELKVKTNKMRPSCLRLSRSLLFAPSRPLLARGNTSNLPADVDHLKPVKTKSQLRWAFRTFGIGPKYKATPLPPKPYDDKVDGNIAVRERAYQERLMGVDPEKPHYRDPQYESRQSTPIFDFFGFNRDYSYSMFKLSIVMIICMLVKEMQAAMVLQEHAMHMQAEQPTPEPEWARNDAANEKELRAAGFALVGYKQLDNVGKRKEGSSG